MPEKAISGNNILGNNILKNEKSIHLSKAFFKKTKIHLCVFTRGILRLIVCRHKSPCPGSFYGV